MKVDKKVDLAIRFVNWFTDSKLDAEREAPNFNPSVS
jgi:hypothetical protein